MPHRVADLRHAELGRGRYILQLLEPLRRRHRDAMQRAGLDLRDRVGDLIPQKIDLPAEQIGDGGRRPAIGDDGRLEAEHIAHHDGAEVAVGADAAMREVRLGALLLDPRDLLLRARARNRLAADQQHRRIVDEADRLEGRLGVVAQVAEQARRGEQRDVIDQHRRAVGRRARDAIVRDGAAAADLVLDDDRTTRARATCDPR